MFVGRNAADDFYNVVAFFQRNGVFEHAISVRADDVVIYRHDRIDSRLTGYQKRRAFGKYVEFIRFDQVQEKVTAQGKRRSSRWGRC